MLVVSCKGLVVVCPASLFVMMEFKSYHLIGAFIPMTGESSTTGNYFHYSLLVPQNEWFPGSQKKIHWDCIHDGPRHIIQTFFEMCEEWETYLRSSSGVKLSRGLKCKILVEFLDRKLVPEQGNLSILNFIFPTTDTTGPTPIDVYLEQSKITNLSRKRKRAHHNLSLDNLMAPYYLYWKYPMDLTYHTLFSHETTKRILRRLCLSLLEPILRVSLNRDSFWTEYVSPYEHKLTVKILNQYIHQQYALNMHVIELIRAHVSPLFVKSKESMVPIFEDLITTSYPDYLYPDALLGIQKYYATIKDSTSIIGEIPHRFTDWIESIYQGLLGVFCCPLSCLSHVFCFYDGIRSQFERSSTLFKYIQLQGLGKFEQDLIVQILHSISIPGTYLYLDSGITQYIGQPSQAFQMWYDVANTIVNEKRKTSSFRERIIQNSIVTVKEQLVDGYQNKSTYSNVLKTVELPMSVIRISTVSSVAEESIDPYKTILPPLLVDLSTEQKEVYKLMKQMQSFERVETIFGIIMRSITWFANISRISNAIGLTQRPETLFARLVINQLINTILGFPILFVSSTEGIDRIVESCVNNAITNEWIRLHKTQYPGTNEIIQIHSRAALTLDIIVWSFCQYFPLFKNNLVETLMGSIFKTHLNIVQSIRLSRAVFLGPEFSDVSSVSLKTSKLDLLMAYYSFERGDLRGKAQFEPFTGNDGEEYVNLNYITISAKSFEELMGVFERLLSNRKDISREKIELFFSTPSPNIRAKDVRPFVKKSAIDFIIERGISNRKVIKAALRNWCNSNGLAYERNTDMIEEKIRNLFGTELKVFDVFVKDGYPFHQSAPKYIYNEKIGLPLFNLTKGKTGVQCRILTDCFQDSYDDILIQSIQSLSNLVKKNERYEVKGMIGHSLKLIEIENTKYDVPFLKIPSSMTNFGSKLKIEKNLLTEEQIMVLPREGFDSFVRLY